MTFEEIAKLYDDMAVTDRFYEITELLEQAGAVSWKLPKKIFTLTQWADLCEWCDEQFGEYGYVMHDRSFWAPSSDDVAHFVLAYGCKL